MIKDTNASHLLFSLLLYALQRWVSRRCTCSVGLIFDFYITISFKHILDDWNMSRFGLTLISTLGDRLKELDHQPPWWAPHSKADSALLQRVQGFVNCQRPSSDRSSHLQPCSWTPHAWDPTEEGRLVWCDSQAIVRQQRYLWKAFDGCRQHWLAGRTFLFLQRTRQQHWTFRRKLQFRRALMELMVQGHNLMEIPAEDPSL